MTDCFSHLSPIRDKLPQQLVRTIRTDILNGKLKPGDKLPSEMEMLKTFCVSRQTLREALRVLEVQGLLNIRPGIGGGAFVCEVDLDTTRQGLINFLHQTDLSLKHICELRSMLDPYFAQLAASSNQNELIEVLKKNIQEQEQYLADEDHTLTRKAAIQFHRNLAQFSDNPLLILLQNFIENLLEILKNQLGPGFAFYEHSLLMHKKILAAIINQDPQAARTAMNEDIGYIEAELFALGAPQDTYPWC